MKDHRYYYLRCQARDTGRWRKDRETFATEEAAEQRARASVAEDGNAAAVELVRVTVETVARFYQGV